MERVAILLVLLLMASAARAETVIDARKGGRFYVLTSAGVYTIDVTAAGTASMTTLKLVPLNGGKPDDPPPDDPPEDLATLVTAKARELVRDTPAARSEMAKTLANGYAALALSADSLDSVQQFKGWVTTVITGLTAHFKKVDEWEPFLDWIDTEMTRREAAGGWSVPKDFGPAYRSISEGLNRV